MNQIADVLSDKKDKKRERVIEIIYFILQYAFLAGQDEMNERLNTDIKLTEMEKVIYTPIAGETFADRVGKYITNDEIDKIPFVVITDTHRVYNEASLGVMQEANIKYKKWQTMEDNLVRDTHQYLDQIRVPLDAYFYTYDGDKAKYPGGFTLAQNNVNCRCILIPE